MFSILDGKSCKSGSNNLSKLKFKECFTLLLVDNNSLGLEFYYSLAKEFNGIKNSAPYASLSLSPIKKLKEIHK